MEPVSKRHTVFVNLEAAVWTYELRSCGGEQWDGQGVPLPVKNYLISAVFLVEILTGWP